MISERILDPSVFQVVPVLLKLVPSLSLLYRWWYNVTCGSNLKGDASQTLINDRLSSVVDTKKIKINYCLLK
jgi:hypothetical protein